MLDKCITKSAIAEGSMKLWSVRHTGSQKRENLNIAASLNGLSIAVMLLKQNVLDKSKLHNIPIKRKSLVGLKFIIDMDK